MRLFSKVVLCRLFPSSFILIIDKLSPAIIEVAPPTPTASTLVGRYSAAICELSPVPEFIGYFVSCKNMDTGEKGDLAEYSLFYLFSLVQ